MKKIDYALQAFPSLNLSVLPTPITKLEKLSQLLGANLYCKRDDLTGFAMGGNKTRKLDFLIAQALDQGKDTLIAVGANQSNFCRIAAGYGAASDMEVHLMLGGKKPATSTGNLLLDHLFGANIHHVDTMNWDEWESRAVDLEVKLTSQGKNVCRLPVGGSTPIGALGYVNAMNEIYEQSKDESIEFTTIIHTTGSAGTQAGLIVGKAMSAWQGNIIGMAVAKDSSRLEKEIKVLSDKTAALLNVEYDQEDIVVEDNYLGREYAARTEKGTEAIELFSRMEGIILDHVYSGKAAAGMIDYARKGRFQEGENILFIHTGGNIEIFE